MKSRTILCSILLLMSFSIARGQTDTAATAATDVAATTAATATPASASAAVDCQSYSKLDSAALPSPATSPLVSTIVVPDAFQVASVAVSDIQLIHSRVGALKISLIAAPPADGASADAADAATSVTLKDVRSGATGANLTDVGFSDSAPASFPADASAAPFSGTWLPTANLTAAFAALPSAAGSWSLRVADLGDKRDSRTIQLVSWTLTLCPAPAGDDPEADADAEADDDTPVAGEEDAAADGDADAEPAEEEETGDADSETAPTAAPAPAAAAANSTAAPQTRVAAGGIGLLEQLLSRIRVNNTSASAATPAAPNAALSDEDARLVDRLLTRLADVNATRPAAAAATAGGGMGGIRAGGGVRSRADGGLFGAANGNSGNDTAAGDEEAGRFTWRLGNITLSDSEGVVSDFLSSLSDVLFSLANGTGILGREGPAAAALDDADPGSSLLGNVSSMAQAAFRSLADSPATMRAVLQDGFRLDLNQRMIDAMPAGGERLRAWLTNSAANMGALADLTGSATNYTRAAALARVQNLGQAAGDVRASVSGSVGNVADYLGGMAELRQRVVADQVAAYNKAVQNAASATRDRLLTSAARVESARKSIQKEIDTMRKQLASLRLRNGSSAASVMGPSLDRLGRATGGLGQASSDLRSGAADSAADMLRAFTARASSTADAAGSRFGSIVNGAGSRYGMSLDAMSGAMGRMQAGLESLTASARNATAQARQTRTSGVDMMQSALSEMQTRVQSAVSGSQLAAATRQRLGDTVAQMDGLQARLESLRRALV